MSIHALNKYKKAKKIVPELNRVLGSIEKSLGDLNQYKRYAPVQDIIETLENNRIIIVAHLRVFQKIIETKGKE